ncbi:Structural maintenance of chromosomes protein 6 [Coemansia aciculifera]|nr:Structural maintenance of chromosomes protein 6 [Coemansia aciculifera]
MAKVRSKHTQEDAEDRPVNGKRFRTETTPDDEYSQVPGLSQDATQNMTQDSSPRRHSSQRNTNVTRVRGRQPNESCADEPEIGIVESIEIVDFMCHEKATVNLCPKVNFITGQNGSGKSAILTALIIALGGKASITNRASSLKGFIREGRQRATVKVQLRNRGPDAYRPELYGSSIVIERQLNTGTVASQYKLRNGDTGEVVSKRKDDLVAITDHMAIQVDNPINILSQDAAREFLASTSPDKMYQFFLKGTQLHQLREDLGAVSQAITRAEANIERKKEVLPEMKAEKKRWEQHYENMKQARDFSAKLTALSQQMAWAIVEEAEDKVRQVDENLGVNGQKVAKIDEKVAEQTAFINGINAEADLLSEQAQELLRQLEPLKAERRVPVEQMEAAKAALRRFKQTEADMNMEARSTRERISSLTAEIATERARMESKDQAGKEKLRLAITALEDNIKEEEARIADLQAEQQTHEERSSVLRETKVGCHREVDKSRDLVTQTRTALEEMMRSTSNRLNAFGRGVVEALDMIDRAKWRNSKPIGPIGKFVKLRNPKFARIIETTLDKTLNAFLVESHADRATLDAIFRRCSCQSRIVICKPELFDYSQGEPDSRFTTMLNMLDIQDEVVKRQLINLNRIEQIILIEQRAEGDKIVEANKGQLPRNVTACLTADGYSVGSKAGGLSTQSNNLIRETSRLGENIAMAIEREKQVLAVRQRALEHAQRSLKETEQELEDLRRKHERSAIAVRQCKERINKANSEIQQTRERLHSNEPAKIAALETELEQFTEQMESLQTQFRDHVTQQKLKEEELEQAKADLVLVDRKVDIIRDRAESKRQAAEEKANQRQTHADHINYWNAKRAALKEKRIRLEQAHAEASAKVEETISEARKVCEERVEVEHAPARLDRMISDCRASLEEIERSSSMSLAEVAEKAQLHIMAYRKANEELRSITQLVNVLKTSHHLRMNKWTQFRESMTMRTKMHFITHLSQRGYTGKLEFDHTQRTLLPKIQTDQDLVSESMVKGGGSRKTGGSSQQDKAGGAERFLRKDTKSLSGGEKSFTTICLLLSLWETMNCPVRALDEFDVFMDAANRAIAMSMMIDSARSKNTTQFILITPLDMSVRPDADITILRLQPPKRTSS